MKLNKQVIPRLTLYIILSLISIIMTLPLYWMISVSLKPPGEVYEYPLKFIPTSINFGNYKIAWVQANFAIYFGNTVIYAVIGTLLTLILCSLGGYTFAKLRFPGRNTLFVVILLSMMIPFATILVPLFLTIKRFPLMGGNNLFGEGGSGLINTFPGLILPGIVSGYYIFLFRQFFSMLPDELIFAARVDGCSEFRIFWEIIVPLSKPVFVAIGIFSFMWRWNAFLWPLIVMTDPKKRVLQVGLGIFQGEQRTGAEWNLMMAAAAIALIPTVVVFLMGQKYFTRGIALTGIKG